MTAFNIQQTEILTALGKALPGIESGNSLIEGADTFVFDGKGTVRSYNDTISVSVTSVALMGLVGAVKAQDLFKVLKRVSESDIQFEIEDDKWKIKSGRGRSKLTRFADNLSQFLECVDTDRTEWVPLPSDFLDALRLCYISGNKAQKRGCYVENNILFSTDNQVLNRYVFAPEIPVGDLYLDDPAVHEIIKLGAFTSVNIGQGWIHFKTEDDVILSAKLKDRTDYPVEGIRSYYQNVDEAVPAIKTTLPAGIQFSADRVSIFSEEVEKATVAEITLSAEGIHLQSYRVSGGQEEDLPWTTPVDLPTPLSALVDPGFLIEAATKAPNLSVFEIGDSPILVFSSDKFTQIGSTRAKAA